MLAADPRAFRITSDMTDQNVYNGTAPVNSLRARFQHAHMCERLGCNVLTIPGDLPDVVFLANAGLVLPRLPEKVILMSRMKYVSRIRETPPLTEAFQALGFKTPTFPVTEVFEGQGEARWFHGGHLLFVGYGFRATARSVTLLRRILGEIYKSYRVLPPRVVGLKLESPYWYHLDMAMLTVHPTFAIVHESAFSKSTLAKMRDFIKVVPIRVGDVDQFCLNAVPTKTKLYVHTLDPSLRRLLGALTGLTIVENDVSEFEKAGGGVRCMILDV